MIRVHVSVVRTYLRVRTADGSVWAAVPLASVQAGSQIRIVNGVALKNFDAPGLARRFDAIVFGVPAAPPGTADRR